MGKEYRRRRSEQRFYGMVLDGRRLTPVNLRITDARFRTVDDDDGRGPFEVIDFKIVDDDTETQKKFTVKVGRPDRLSFFGSWMDGVLKRRHDEIRGELTDG